MTIAISIPDLLIQIFWVDPRDLYLHKLSQMISRQSVAQMTIK